MILGHQAGRDGRPTVKRFFCAFCYRDALARVVQTQQMTPNLAEQWYLIDVNEAEGTAKLVVGDEASLLTIYHSLDALERIHMECADVLSLIHI